VRGTEISIFKKEVRELGDVPQIDFPMAEIARRVGVGASAIAMAIRRKNS
jgi:hypothetical protein